MVKATKIFVEKLKCTLIAKLKLDEDMTFRGWIIWRLLDACISWHALKYSLNLSYYFHYHFLNYAQPALKFTQFH